MSRLQDRPLDLVVFGSLGDLARRKLFPSLYALFQKKVLPNDLRIIAVTRQKATIEEFALGISEHVFSGNAPDEQGSEEWNKFISQIVLIDMDLNAAEDYKRLSKLFKDPERIRVFYLAVSPKFFPPAIKQLGKAGMLDDRVKSRIVIEKPHRSPGISWWYVDPFS